MKNPSLFLFILILSILELVTTRSLSKEFPAEGAKLNYRIIGFSYPPVAGYSNSYIQIAKGTVTAPAQFLPVITSQETQNNRLIAEVPEFGTDYTWRIIYKSNDNKIVKSELFHFSTLTIPLVTNVKYSLNVIKKNKKFNKQYIFVDYSNAMFDMDGNPVWFLPQMAMATDLKITPQHTITCFSGPKIREVNYDGQIIWAGPGVEPVIGGSSQPVLNALFHHEFSRLANGHYMALGWMLKGNDTAKRANDTGNHRFFNNGEGENMIREFDKAGNVVWSWNSQDYIMHADVSPFYESLLTKKGWRYDCHENSFYFDENNKVIYLSYAGYNRIIKISYPSGKVLNTYGVVYDAVAGGKMLSDSSLSGNILKLAHEEIFNNKLFMGQHSCKLTKDGNILIYNDRMGTTTSPSIMVLKQTGKDGIDGLEKVWEYSCIVDSANKNMDNGGGGCVYELAGGELLVSMNYPNGKIFIVDKDKKILWTAIPEQTDQGGAKPFCPYRSSMVTNAELEQLIWTSEGINPAETTHEQVASYKIMRP